MCQWGGANRYTWVGYRMSSSMTLTNPKPRGRKSATSDWAHHLGVVELLDHHCGDDLVFLCCEKLLPKVRLKQNPRQQHQAETIDQNIRINRKVLEEVNQFRYLGSTQSKDGTSLKEVKTTLAPARSGTTGLAIQYYGKTISFPTKIKL